MTDASLHILIALSAAGESHGYALMRDIATQTSGRVQLYPGTLYSNLKRLVEEEFVEELEDGSQGGADERRRYYRITHAGRRAVRDEVGRLQDILRFARLNGALKA